MQQTVSMLKKVFENHGLDYELDEDFTFSAVVDYGGQITCVPLIAVIKEDEYLVYATFPHKIPAESMPRVAEYLHRANNFFPYCNFELDYGDAEVRVKSYVNFNHCQISYAVAEESIFCPLNMLRMHYNSLMRTIYSTDSIPALLEKAREDFD